jgi:hypothetical protein
VHSAGFTASTAPGSDRSSEVAERTRTGHKQIRQRSDRRGGQGVMGRWTTDLTDYRCSEIKAVTELGRASVPLPDRSPAPGFEPGFPGGGRNGHLRTGACCTCLRSRSTTPNYLRALYPLSYRPTMLERTGLEPVTSCSRSRCCLRTRQKSACLRSSSAVRFGFFGREVTECLRTRHTLLRSRSVCRRLGCSAPKVSRRTGERRTRRLRTEREAGRPRSSVAVTA